MLIARKLLLLILVVITIASCGTGPQFIRNDPAGYPLRHKAAEIQVYYAEPNKAYISIGLINWDYYQPGFRAPSITDLIPELQNVAAKEGGDALIIRKQEIPPLTERNLRVVAEIIRFKD
jgi:hypothetical protein